MSKRGQPHVTAADKYARGVVAGRVTAGKWVRLACDRYLADRRSERTKGFRYKFDAEKAERVCRFLELLPHVKGRWARRDPAKPGVNRLRLEDWQCFIVVNLFGWVRKGTEFRRFRKGSIYLPRKNGKALALDTPIPTPGGWRELRDIRPGDSLFGADGQPCRVLVVSETFVGRPCYRVAFADGSSVVASGDHLWQTRHRFRPWAGARVSGSGSGGDPRVEVVTTEQIADSVRLVRPDGGVEYNHGIAVSGALQTPGVDLPLDPYMLGAWLGDGNTADARLTCGDEDVAHFVAEVRRVVGGEPVMRRHHTAWTVGLTTGRGGRHVKVQSVLRRLGVLGEKHIPDVYLWAGTEQRRSLLQGLMDTDGTITPTGKSGAVSCAFTTTARALADGVLQLARSLGIKAAMQEGVARLRGRDIGPRFVVQFTASQTDMPFRLARKVARLPASVGRRSRTLKIVSCERVDSVPTRCLMVDSPDRLFLAGCGMTPTHNSTLAAGVGWWMFAKDGEPGAEVYSGATTEKQAWEVFGPARQMALAEPLIPAGLGVTVNASNMIRLEDASKFEPIIGKPGDGASPHCAIVDEYHEHPTADLYDTMLTGMGAREQPLHLVISTAGYDISGPCYDDWLTVQKVLEGTAEDPTHFGIIYAADPEDDWTSEIALRKANPNAGVSVSIEFLQSQLRDAISNPRKQGTFRTKHLNLWENARDAYVNMQRYAECRDVSLRLDTFAGSRCVIGLDLASKIDIAAVELLFPREGGRYARFGRYYLPDETVQQPENDHYRGWARAGLLTVTDGNIIDFGRILEDLIGLAAQFQVEALAYDPFQATMLVTELMNAGLPCVEVKPTVLNLSEPMKQIDALIRDRKLAHDGDPVMAWMMSNVVAKVDAKDNVYPRKERPEAKIDGFVALCMAMNRAMTAADPVVQGFVEL